MGRSNKSNTSLDANCGKSRAQIKAENEANNLAYKQKRQKEIAQKKQQKAQSDPFFTQTFDNSAPKGISPELANMQLDNAQAGVAAAAPAMKTEGAAYEQPKASSSAEKAHKEVEEEMVIEKGNAGDQKAGYKEGVEPEKGKADGKESKGVFAHLKQDLAHTKAAFGEASDIIGGGAKTVDGADSITDSAEAYKQLKKTGGDYLSNMGRGHKGLGVAKLGGYMVGASMLVDMLNPFDDD